MLRVAFCMMRFVSDTVPLALGFFCCLSLEVTDSHKGLYLSSSASVALEKYLTAPKNVLATVQKIKVFPLVITKYYTKCGCRLMAAQDPGFICTLELCSCRSNSSDSSHRLQGLDVFGGFWTLCSLNSIVTDRYNLESQFSGFDWWLRNASRVGTKGAFKLILPFKNKSKFLLSSTSGMTELLRLN